MMEKRHIGRPNKAVGLVPKRTKNDRIDFIMAYQAKAQLAYNQAATYAILIGLELEAARDCDTPKDFQLIVDACDLTEATLWKYMQLASRAKTMLTPEKVQEITAMLYMQPSALEPKKVRLLTESIQQLTDNRSINDLFSSWRLAPKSGEAAPAPSQMTAEDLAAKEKNEYQMETIKLAKEVQNRFLRKQIWTRCDGETIINVAIIMTQLTEDLAKVADTLDPEWRKDVGR